MRGKHIILTLGRSGSNTLVDMFNQNPAILNFGEVLGEWNRIRRVQRALRLFQDGDQAYLDAVLCSKMLQRTANMVRTVGKIRAGKWSEAKRMHKIRTVGFKEFSLNFRRYGLPNYVANAADVKVIGLTRSNVLNRMVSTAFLEATGIVASTSAQAKATHQKLHLDPDSVITKLEVIEQENQELTDILDALAPSRVFRLDYEDLYADEMHTVTKLRSVYAFLGAPDVIPRVRMRKIVHRNPLSALDNGHEVAEVIATSRFAAYLPDGDKS
ncbi:hypothetical protein [Marivita sp.]|uniref:hypothetical protein n=1 Tax=Marivita sp. TaxID=2003365 RepID=UPI0025BC030A|nr:hypothetical protein [Marivita sp.]